MDFADGEEDDHSHGFGLRVMLAAVFTLFAVVFFIIVFHFYLRRRRRQLSLSRRLADQPPLYQIRTQVLPIDHVESARSPNRDRQGLDPSVIASIPKLWYKQTDQFNGSETVECSVCLAIIVEDAAVRVLPNCKHVFHVDCVDTWFASNTTCPICRTVAEPASGAAQPTAPPASESGGTI